jgi:WD40 repeat protein
MTGSSRTVWGFVVGITIIVLAGLHCEVDANEVKPHISATWLEKTPGKPLRYRCSIDTGTPPAAALKLALQFRSADEAKTSVQTRKGDDLVLWIDEWQHKEGSRLWFPKPATLSPELFNAKAALRPGRYVVDAIFDLYDPEMGRYIDSGYNGRAALLLHIDRDGATLEPVSTRGGRTVSVPLVVLKGDEIPVADDTPSGRSSQSDAVDFPLLPPGVAAHGPVFVKHDAGTGVPFAGFTHDGAAVVTGDTGRNIVKVWQPIRVKGGTVLRTPPMQVLRGRPLKAGHVVMLILAPDGALIDPMSGEALSRIQRLPKGIFAARLSPKGERLYIAAEDLFVEYEVLTGQPVRRVELNMQTTVGDAGRQNQGWISGDGRYVATSIYSKSNEVQVHDTMSGSKRLTTWSPCGEQAHVAQCDGGRMLAAVQNGNKLRLFDLASGEEKAAVDLDWRVIGPAFSPQGDRIAVAENDTVHMFDASTLERRWTWQTGYRIENLAFDLEGHELLVADLRHLRGLNATTGHEKWQYPFAAVCLGLDPEGERIAALSCGGVLHVCHPSDEPLQGLVTPLTGIDANGGRIAAISELGAAGVWNADGKPILLADVVRPNFSPRAAPLLGSDARAHVVSINAGGRRLLTADRRGSATLLWNLEAGRPSRRLYLPRGPVLCGVLSPDGTKAMVAYAGDKQQKPTAVLWDVERYLILAEHRGRCSSAVFAPDGSYAVMALSGNAVRVSLKNPGRLQQIAERVSLVAVSPDSRRAACLSGGGGRIVVSDGAPPLTISLLDPDKPFGGSAAFSHDGNVLYVVMQDGSVSAYDVATGRRVRHIEREYPVRRLAVDRTSERLYLATERPAVASLPPRTDTVD